MSYQLPIKQKKTGKKSLIIALSIIAIVMGVYYVFPSTFASVTVAVSKPVIQSKNFVASAINSSQFFHSKVGLIDENTRLKKENQDLSMKLISFDLISSQNNELRNFLGVRKKLNGTTVPVIMHPAQSPYDVLVLSLENNNSVKEGDLIVSGPIAIGSISQVSGATAKATLYTNPGAITEGRIVKNGTPIMVKGIGGGNFVYSAPRELPVAVGDLISLSSNPDFVIAKIADIDESDSDSFKTLRMTNLINMFSLQFVEIIYGQ